MSEEINRREFLNQSARLSLWLAVRSVFKPTENSTDSKPFSIQEPTQESHLKSASTLQETEITPETITSVLKASVLVIRTGKSEYFEQYGEERQERGMFAGSFIEKNGLLYFATAQHNLNLGQRQNDDLPPEYSDTAPMQLYAYDEAGQTIQLPWTPSKLDYFPPIDVNQIRDHFADRTVLLPVPLAYEAAIREHVTVLEILPDLVQHLDQHSQLFVANHDADKLNLEGQISFDDSTDPLHPSSNVVRVSFQEIRVFSGQNPWQSVTEQMGSTLLPPPIFDPIPQIIVKIEEQVYGPGYNDQEDVNWAAMCQGWSGSPLIYWDGTNFYFAGSFALSGLSTLEDGQYTLDVPGTSFTYNMGPGYWKECYGQQTLAAFRPLEMEIMPMLNP